MLARHIRNQVFKEIHCHSLSMLLIEGMIIDYLERNEKYLYVSTIRMEHLL